MTDNRYREWIRTGAATVRWGVTHPFSAVSSTWAAYQTANWAYGSKAHMVVTLSDYAADKIGTPSLSPYVPRSIPALLGNVTTPGSEMRQLPGDLYVALTSGAATEQQRDLPMPTHSTRLDQPNTTPLDPGAPRADPGSDLLALDPVSAPQAALDAVRARPDA